MILQILKEIGKSLLLAIMTEKFIKSLIIWGLEKLAAKSENKLDDELVAKVREALESTPK